MFFIVDPSTPSDQNWVTVSLFDKGLLPAIEDLSCGIDLKREKLSKSDESRIFNTLITSLEDAIDIQKKWFAENSNDQTLNPQNNESVDNINNLLNDDTYQALALKKNEDGSEISEEEMDDLIVTNDQDEKENEFGNMFLLPSNKSKSAITNVKLVLYIDNREKVSKQERNYLYNKLTEQGVYWEQRNLSLGDFLWVIRIPWKQKKSTKTKSKSKKQKEIEEEKIEDETSYKTFNEESVGKAYDTFDWNNPDNYSEYVMNLIVERKTGNDLASSIRDGRYKEQKFRLKNSGIGNVIYLIEGKSTSDKVIPEASLENACLHTRIYNGFNIIKTANDNETLKWLIYTNNWRY